MKIGLQTWGTDGDVLPFIALGKGLVNAGHEVTLAYTSIDGKSYSEEGIRMIEANESIDFNPPPNPYAMGEKSGSFGEYVALIENYFDPFTESMFRASEILCRENDLVIGHSICHTLLTASELHKCSRVALALAPMVVRSNTISPTGESFGTFVNGTMWSIGDQISTRMWFKEGKKIREKVGLPKIRSLQNELFTSKILTIVGCSPSLVDRPEDWVDNVVMTGFLSTQLPDVEVPRKLQEFLDQGEPPIYMTFGSCMEFQPKQYTEILVEAALLSGRRAIIQTSVNHPAFEESEHLYRVDQTPHSSVFPQCSLVVHHGGAGTTQSALHAGKPSVVVAHGFDQPYWAKRLCRLGVGGEPLSIDNVSEADLSKAIMEVMNDPDANMNAFDVSQALVKENGVASAVIEIERVLAEI